jgi:hypothetical protein
MFRGFSAIERKALVMLGEANGVYRSLFRKSRRGAPHIGGLRVIRQSEIPKIGLHLATRQEKSRYLISTMILKIGNIDTASNADRLGSCRQGVCCLRRCLHSLVAPLATGNREYTARSEGSLGSRCMPCRRDYHPHRAARYLTVLLLPSGQCFPGVDRENVGKTHLRFENAEPAKH